MLHIIFRQDRCRPARRHDRLNLLLSRFWRRADGATALEFALISPVLLLVTLGALEIGMMMFNMITIEGGLREAARYGTTGQQTTDDRVQEIVDKLNQYAVGPVTISKDNVPTTTATTTWVSPIPISTTTASGMRTRVRREPAVAARSSSTQSHILGRS
jgi:Flp pilus assembly protein TadG